MTSISLFNLYGFLQRSLKVNDSTISLLLDAFKKLTSSSPEEKKEKITLDILYPARDKTTDESFFKKKSIDVVLDKSKVDALKRLSQSGPITPGYRAPRNPIVLCHGLFGFDVRGPKNIPVLQFHYWSGVEETLAKLGAKIIVTRVPQTGSIWERSSTLHQILESILVDQKVNFVAHSMGGLDCRHLLANVKQRSYKAESLTTICTPHRGSPVMDWFRDNLGLGRPKHYSGSQDILWANSSALSNKSTATTREDSSNTIPQVLINWLDEPAYAHLTTDFCKDYFNPNTPDDPSVQYYSYGAAAQFPAWSSLLSWPYQMVHEKEGDNDGIVSIQSAKWGKYVKTIHADHWDFSGKSLIPYRLRTSKSENGQEFDRLDFYAEMATHLYDQGH